MVAFALEVVQSLLEVQTLVVLTCSFVGRSWTTVLHYKAQLVTNAPPWQLYTEKERFLEYKQMKDNTAL